MSTKIQKVRYAIYNNPTLIKYLFKDTSINKGMINRELYKLLPCRIGIEFELGGQFAEGFKKKYKFKKVHNETISAFYGLLEVKGDYIGVKNYKYSDKIIEIRVSLKDYHQLAGLYKFMQDLKEFCKIHEGGGIHIHIDLSDFITTSNKVTIKNYITNRLNLISKMFPKYTGHYNEKKVGVQEKRSWVNISRLNTLEFRILPLTFEYNILINWIFQISRFRKILIKDIGTSIDKKEIVSKISSSDLLSYIRRESNDLIYYDIDSGSIGHYTGF